MKKTAVITGALGGIGRVLCAEFQKAGYVVIAMDRREGACSSDHLLHFDVRELCRSPDLREQVQASIGTFLRDDGLTVLINNAAIQLLNRTDDITLEDWNETLQTNLMAPFMLMQLLLPQLEKGKGSVVNIASIHAVATKPRFICYATSKSALVGMTRALAVDLGPRVRVNAISPAATATPMLLAGFEGKSEEFDELARMHPLERIAQPWEVAKAALFLASPDAAFITGACMQLDGGIGGRLHDPV